MKLPSRLTILAIITILVAALFYFKPIWKDRLIPFPGNLLVSYFSPWKEEAWPGYPTGVPRKGLLGFDTVRMMGPWRNFITNEIKSVRFPSWNPHQFGGAPMSANFQSALFFPPNLIYLILPFYIAWTILIIFQSLLASFGMYLLLKSLFVNQRLTTNNQFLTTILPSLAYGFSSWMSVWIEWNIHGFAYALLPLALLFIHKRETILTILTISLIVFAGHPQMAMIGITALLVASVVWRKFRWMTAALSVVALITSVQWWPALKYYQQASREQQSGEFIYSKTLLPWSQFPQLIAPNFFGNPATGNFSGKLDFLESTAYSGIAILGFAFIGLISFLSSLKFPLISSKFLYGPIGDKTTHHQLDLTEKLSLAILSLVILLSFPTPLSLLIGKLNIPILSTSVASRWLMLWPLATILLAAAGISRSLSCKSGPCSAGRNFLQSNSVSQTYMTFVFTFIMISGLWIYALLLPPEFRSVAARNLAIPSGISLLLMFYLVAQSSPKMLLITHDRKLLLTFIFALIVFGSISELILFGWKTMPYTEKRFIYPVVPVLAKLQELSRGGSRFAATDGSVLESNFATYYGLYDLSGYDALYPRKIGELVWTASNNGIPVNDFSRSTVVMPTKQSDARNNLWNLAGVRWIINKDDMLADHPGQKSNDLSSDFKLIWEEGKWQIYENTQAYPRAFFTNNLHEISSVSLAEIVSYQANAVEIKVDALSDGYLILTDTFYPGWKATIDSSEVNIVPAFGAFRAVPVVSGTHMVKFTYNSL